MGPLLGLVLVAGGCKHRNPKAFWRNLAKETCKWSKQCEPVAFDHTYSGLVDCRYDDYDRNGDPEQFAAGCDDYDEEVGERCLGWLVDQRETCALPTGQPSACEGICGEDTFIEFGVSRSAEGGRVERVEARVSFGLQELESSGSGSGSGSGSVGLEDDDEPPDQADVPR